MTFLIKYDIENKEPSFLPDGNWSLIFDDEFDQGKLDTSKWDFRRSMMGKECKHWVGDEGIEFDDDNIIFKLIEKAVKMLFGAESVSSSVFVAFFSIKWLIDIFFNKLKEMLNKFHIRI